MTEPMCELTIDEIAKLEADAFRNMDGYTTKVRLMPQTVLALCAAARAHIAGEREPRRILFTGDYPAPPSPSQADRGGERDVHISNPHTIVEDDPRWPETKRRCEATITDRGEEQTIMDGLGGVEQSTGEGSSPSTEKVTEAGSIPAPVHHKSTAASPGDDGETLDQKWREGEIPLTRPEKVAWVIWWLRNLPNKDLVEMSEAVRSLADAKAELEKHVDEIVEERLEEIDAEGEAFNKECWFALRKLCEETPGFDWSNYVPDGLTADNAYEFLAEDRRFTNEGNEQTIASLRTRITTLEEALRPFTMDIGNVTLGGALGKITRDNLCDALPRPPP